MSEQFHQQQLEVPAKKIESAAKKVLEELIDWTKEHLKERPHLQIPGGQGACFLIPELEISGSPNPAGEAKRSPGREKDRSDRKPLYEHEDPLKDIRPENVRQGDVGDCYFLSTLASLARENPRAIENMIKDNGNGTYTVTFPGDKSHPVTVAAPADVYLQKHAHYGGGTWANVLELAHRKYTGKWSDTAGPTWKAESGDDPARAIQLLTGRSAESEQTKDISDANLRRIIQGSVSAANPIVAATGSDACTPASAIPSTKIEAGHAYTIEGYDPITGRITLRNPWGYNEDGHGGTSMKNGEFTLSLDDFKKAFPFICHSLNFDHNRQAEQPGRKRSINPAILL